MAALAIQRRDAVCLTGAGGKTSLLFQLAREARAKGMAVLVTTTTRMLVPEKEQYDSLALDGTLPWGEKPEAGKIHAAGRQAADAGKMAGIDEELLRRAARCFDLLLIEADGAACKRLKGWRTDEPVIPPWTTRTIGVVDISAIGCAATDTLVHRLKLFLSLTGAEPGTAVKHVHLQRLITAPNGLFQHARGERVVFFNRMEREIDFTHGLQLRQLLGPLTVAAGSLQDGQVYV